jgi:uncharacterized protein YqjF (DUF2071 family)
MPAPEPSPSTCPFLTARWSNLALVTYALRPEALLAMVPPGCELDLREGSAFVSLVAFDFLRTRVVGLPWRFYVRRQGQRGVCFIREYVPQRLVAGVARLVYNEPYVAARMTSRIERTDSTITVHHALTLDDRIQTLSVTGRLRTVCPAADSIEHFFKEHEWGFGRTRSGRLIRYRVEHPIWDIHPLIKLELKWDWERVYGPKWGFLQDAQPYSSIRAAGSAVRVFPKGALRSAQNTTAF